MRFVARAVAFFGAFSLAACGGETATSKSASAGGEVEACWPVAPMRLVAQRGTEWVTMVEMTGDGSIYAYKAGRRRFYARVSKDALLDAHEVPTLTCIHRVVSEPAGAEAAHYGERDEYLGNGTTISIDDDGTIHAGQTESPIRIEGPIAKTRRTAALLVVAVMSNPLKNSLENQYEQ